MRGDVMRTTYTNLQTFEIARRFSVQQRKFMWLLKKHPKRFNRRRGAKWEIFKIPTTYEERQMFLSRTLWAILEEKQRVHKLQEAETSAER